MGVLAVSVAGTDRSSAVLDFRKISWDLPVNGRGLLKVAFQADHGGFAPARGDAFELTEDGTRRFAGKLLRPKRTILSKGSPSKIGWECTVVDKTEALDRRRVTERWVNTPIQTIVSEINTNHLDGEGLTVNVDAGPNITIGFEGVTVRDALEDLLDEARKTEAEGRGYWIDENDVLQVRLNSSIAFPATLNGSNVIWNREPWEEPDDRQYRNVQHVVGGTAEKPIKVTRPSPLPGGELVEHWQRLPDVANAAAAQAAADALLARYGTIGQRARLPTRVVGFRAGQQGTVNVAELGLSSVTMFAESVRGVIPAEDEIFYVVMATTIDPTNWQLQYRRRTQQIEREKPSRRPIRQVRPAPTTIERSFGRSGPAASGDFDLHQRYKRDRGELHLRAHNGVTAQVDIGVRFNFEFPAPVTITVVDSGDGVTVTDNGTRSPVVETDGLWSLAASSEDQIIFDFGGPLPDDGQLLIDLFDLDVGGGGADRVRKFTFGGTPVAWNIDATDPVQVGPVTLSPGVGGDDGVDVRDGARDGGRGQAYKTERDQGAGYLDKFGDGRFAGGLRTRDGVSVLVDTDDGAIGPSLLRETGGPALNDAYAKSVDDMENIQDGATHAKVQAVYLDSNRPAKLRRPVGGVDVDADDIFDVTREDTTDITEAGSIEFINGTYTDGSRRPITVRRVVGAVDVDVDDVFDTTREDTDDITESVTRKHIDGGYVDGSRRPITVRRSVGGVDVDADDVFDVTREDLGDVPDDAGGVWRKIKAVNASGEATLDSYAAESVGNAKVAVETLERTRLADHAIVGRQIDEQMVDEFQNMGSGLSDTGWDNLET